MARERRVKITVKVPETLWHLLDRKRERDDITLQHIGESCFKAWLHDPLEKIRVEMVGLSSAEMESVGRYAEFLKGAPMWLKVAVDILVRRERVGPAPGEGF